MPLSMGTRVSNDALAARMAPVLNGAANGKVAMAPLPGASEDCSYFAREALGLYVFRGVTPENQDPATAAPNHNPNFFADESALIVGARALASIEVDFLGNAQGVPASRKPGS